MMMCLRIPTRSVVVGAPQPGQRSQPRRRGVISPPPPPESETRAQKRWSEDKKDKYYTVGTYTVLYSRLKKVKSLELVINNKYKAFEYKTFNFLTSTCTERRTTLQFARVWKASLQKLKLLHSRFHFLLHILLPPLLLAELPLLVPPLHEALLHLAEIMHPLLCIFEQRSCVDHPILGDFSCSLRRDSASKTQFVLKTPSTLMSAPPTCVA